MDPITFDAVLDRLHKVRRISGRRAMAQCPAHADRTPSLSIRERNGRVLLHCFTGCRYEEIVAALGFDPSDRHRAYVEPTPARSTAPSPRDVGELARHQAWSHAALVETYRIADWIRSKRCLIDRVRAAASLAGPTPRVWSLLGWAAAQETHVARVEALLDELTSLRP